MMKQTVLGSVALLVCLLFVNMTAGTAPYQSKAGKFSVAFNAAPTLSEQDVPTEVGNIKMYMFMHEVSATKVYMVAYCDYPAEMVKEADAATWLQGAKEGVVGKFEAQITEEVSSKFQGHDAVDFSASGPQYHTAYKLVLAANRLYQVGVLQTEGPVGPSDKENFIRSFKITK